MTGLSRRTTAVFVSVAAACVTIGWAGIAVGLPGAHDYEGAIPPTSFSPLYGNVAVWSIYALLVLAGAVVRARALAQRAVNPRGTAWRGSLWLWGAIGAPWFWWWARTDLALYGMDPPEAPADVAVPPILLIAMWWWMGSLVCLAVATVWSAVAAIAGAHSARGFARRA